MTTNTTPRTATSASLSARQATEFLTECHEAGWTVTVKTHGSDPVVTIERHFAPGDTASYVECDGQAFGLLAKVPTVTYGSTWGTDGASVGGHAGLTGGYYRLNKSGVSKRFAAALVKAMSR